MSKLEKRRLILYIVAVVLVYAIIKGLPLISDSLTKTYIASYGDLQIVDKTTAYFVRNERVYFAGNSGKVNSFIDQGELIQNGTTVMEIVGSHQGEVSDKFEYIIANNKTNGVFTTSYSNLAQGIVSYYADGYEETLTPNTMENISYTVLESMTNDKVKKLKRDRVVKGEPVFKIINNSHWYMLCYIEKKHANRYHKGDMVEAAFEEDYVKVKVHNVLDRGDKTLLILKSNRYYEGADRLRISPVDIITTDQKGLLVENNSITTKNKVVGVYVKSVSGNINFVPISIIESDDDYSIVERSFFYDEEGEIVDTINIYDEILKQSNKNKL